MNWFSFIRDKHALVFKVILYLVSTIILTWLLPNGEKYSLNTLRQLNHWPYPALKADREFYLKKSDLELKAEQGKILSESPLYYKENTSERDHLLNELDKELTGQALSKEMNQVKFLLDSIYSVGVIEKPLAKDSSKVIFVIKDGVAEQSAVYNYFTVESAMGLLQKRLSELKDGSKLIQMGLDYLAITVYFDKKLTDKSINENLAAISLYKASFEKGDVLIEKYESLSNEKRDIIVSYLQNRSLTSENSYLQFLGRFMIALLLFGILMLYLAFFRKNIFGQNKQITFIFLVVIVSAFFSNLVSSYGVLFFWSLPFALIAVLIRIFFDSRTALFTFLISILFCSFYANDKFQFIFIQLTIGMGTVFSVAEMRRRKELLFSALVVFMFYLFSFIAFNFANGISKYSRKKRYTFLSSSVHY